MHILDRDEGLTYMLVDIENQVVNNGDDVLVDIPDAILDIIRKSEREFYKWQDYLGALWQEKNK